MKNQLHSKAFEAILYALKTILKKQLISCVNM